MRLTFPLLLVVVLLAVVVVGKPFAVASADESVAVATADNVVVSYRIADLPVWSEGGETFAPAILMTHLKASVAPDSWGKTSRMASSSKSRSLVISTTRENHKIIQNTLQALREQHSSHES